MSQNKSFLPPPEEIKQENRMKIVQLVVQDFPHTVEEVNLGCQNTGMVISLEKNAIFKDGYSETTQYVQVFSVEDERVKGYMPSRSWIDPDGRLHLSFYVSPTIPEEARPFFGGPMYVVIIPQFESEVIDYDFTTRLFIDQIVHEGYVYNVILFGQKEYDNFVVKK